MSDLSSEKMQSIIEAALFVAGSPVSLHTLQNLFSEEEKPSTSTLKSLLSNLKTNYAEKGIELREVGNGYRFQAKSELSPWLSKLWEERAPRYSRAFLETLAIIAYKQPATRAEIEQIRGVTVSSQIIKSLQERNWIKILGYREVPGKPAIYGTTKEFLDYFNLKGLSELPPLAEFKEMAIQDENLNIQLALANSDVRIDSSNIPEENRIEISEKEEETAIN